MVSYFFCPLSSSSNQNCKLGLQSEEVICEKVRNGVGKEKKTSWVQTENMMGCSLQATPQLET